MIGAVIFPHPLPIRPNSMGHTVGAIGGRLRGISVYHMGRQQTEYYRDDGQRMDHRTLKSKENQQMGRDSTFHYQNMKRVSKLINSLEGFNEKSAFEAPARIMPFSGMRPTVSGYYNTNIDVHRMEISSDRLHIVLRMDHRITESSEGMSTFPFHYPILVIWPSPPRISIRSVCLHTPIFPHQRAINTSKTNTILCQNTSTVRSRLIVSVCSV